MNVVEVGRGLFRNYAFGEEMASVISGGVRYAHKVDKARLFDEARAYQTGWYRESSSSRMRGGLL